MIFSESLEAPRRAFLESLRVRNYSPATLGSRGEGVGVFYRFLVSRVVDDLREVSRETIRDYQLWLSAQSYTTRTVHTRLMAVRMFFEYLEKTDAILVNPCVGLLLPTLEDYLPRNILTPAEARAVLDAPDTQTRKGIRDKAILELFYSTGIRREEMTQLTIHDVDFRNGFVRVNKGKFAKDRVVPMGSKASGYVREYLQKVRSVWSQERKDERALWLSSISPHGPLKKQAIAVYVKNYGIAAGVKRRVTPHVWRHTCATHMVAGGSNIAYVQRLLGHRTLQTTQIYTRVAVPEVKQTFRRSHPRSRAVRRLWASCLWGHSITSPMTSRYRLIWSRRSPRLPTAGRSPSMWVTSTIMYSSTTAPWASIRISFRPAMSCGGVDIGSGRRLPSPRAASFATSIGCSSGSKPMDNRPSGARPS